MSLTLEGISQAQPVKTLISLPNPIVRQIFYEVLKQLPNLTPSKLSAYLLVSKEFRRLFQAARFQFLFDLLQIPLVLPKVKNLDEKIATGVKLDGLIKNRDPEPILNSEIRRILEGKSKDIAPIKTLLRAGADPNASNKYGNFPLWIVLVHEPFSKKDIALELIQLLLDYGADPNGSDKRSILHLILEERPCSEEYRDFQFKLLNLLCGKGADPTKTFPNSVSPYQYAKENYPLAAQLFEKYIKKK